MAATLVINGQDNASAVIKRLESNIIRFVGSVSAALASIEVATSFITEASKLEAAMKDVQKTTGFTDESIGKLSRSLLVMAKDVGVAAESLAKIGATAGQLGLGQAGQEAIQAFTKSTAIAQNTLDITSEAAASAGAEISQVFTLAISNVEKIFSTINEVSNTSVASAASIIDIVKRVGSVANTSFPQVAALAGATKDLGIPDEQAGTFLVKFLGNMLAEAKKFAAVMNVTTESWVGKVKRDSIGAFKEVLLTISRLPGGIREQVSKELAGSGRLFSAVDKFANDASNGFVILNKNLKAANDSFASGRSSIEEYAVVTDALGKQTDKLSATLNSLAIQAGQEVLPTLTAIVKSLSSSLSGVAAEETIKGIGRSFRDLAIILQGGIESLREYAAEIRNVARVAGLFIAFKASAFVIGLLISGVGKLGTIILSIVTGVSRLQIALTTIAIAASPLRTLLAFITTSSIGTALAAWGTLFAPIGVAILSIGRALGTAIPLIIAFSRTYGVINTLGATFGYLLLQIVAIGRALPGLIAGFIIANPVFAIIAAAAAAAFIYRKEILNFLGIVDEATQRNIQRAAEAQAERDKAIQDGINVFDEASTQIDARIKARREASTAEAKAVIDNLNAVGKEVQVIGNLKDAYSSVVTEVGQLGRAIASSVDKIQGYKDANLVLRVKLDDTGKEKAKIEERIRELQSIFDKESLSLRPNLEVLRAVSSEIYAQTTRLATVEADAKAITEEYKANGRAITRNIELTSQYEVELDKARGRIANMADSAKLIDLASLIADAKDVEEGLRKAQEKLTELKKAREEINKLPTDSSSNIQVKEGQRSDNARQQAQYNIVIDEGNTKLKRLNEEIKKKAEQDNVSTSAVKAFTEASRENLRVYVDTAAKIKLTTEASKTHDGELLRNAEAITKAYVQAKLFSESLQSIAERAQSLKKHLQGAFDNVATELLSIEAAYRKLTLSIDSLNKSAANTVASKNATTDIDAELAKKKQQIEFNAELAESSGQYTQQYINEQKAKQIAEAEFSAQQQKDQIAARDAALAYATAVQNVQDSIEKATVARDAGDLAGADVLIGQAKNSYEEALGLYKNISDLTKTIDVSGHIAESFSPQAKQKLLDKLTQVKQTLVDSIPDLRAQLLDDATKASEKLDSAASAWAQQLQLSAVLLSQLSSVDAEKAAALVVAAGAQLRNISEASKLGQITGKVDINQADIDKALTLLTTLDEKFSKQGIRVGVQRPTDAELNKVKIDSQKILDTSGAANSLSVGVDDKLIGTEAANTVRKFNQKLVGNDVSLGIKADVTGLYPEVDKARKIVNANRATLPVGLDSTSIIAIQQDTNSIIGTIENRTKGVKLGIYADGDVSKLKTDMDGTVSTLEQRVNTLGIKVKIDPKTGVPVFSKQIVDLGNEAVAQANGSIAPVKVKVDNNSVDTLVNDVLDQSNLTIGKKGLKLRFDATNSANEVAPAVDSAIGQVASRIAPLGVKLSVDAKGNATFSQQVKDQVAASPKIDKQVSVSVDSNSVADTSKAINAGLEEGGKKAVIRPQIDSEFSRDVSKSVEDSAKGITFKELMDSISSSVISSVESSVAELSKAGLSIDINGNIYERQLQNLLDEMSLSIGIQGRVAVRGGPQVQSNAKGGPIVGPGTGTSDDILSWLSNGEYVVDAFTTSFFGSNYFQTLQSYARMGKKGLPAFAGGGPVGVQSLNPTLLGSGAVDKVEVTLRSGNQSARVIGDRDEVRRFVDILQGIR